ncbi:hypothetical protein [Paracidovorax sp. MALMAid1276]|uniref:hypothetical protein n=1 Tax=Paracidovorax sp. MALMAid1276 TaxID=3411631 RepID=UPI003B995ED2
MTSFAHTHYPTAHPGVERAENTVAALRRAAASFDGARGTASILRAAGVAALLVLASQVVDTWGEGHRVAAWMVLWVVAFVGIVLFSAPARRAGVALKAASARWAESRRRAIEDDKLWQLAVQDRRVMADISHALDRRAVDDIRKYR